MAVVTTNLGTVTAYGDAVAAGYTGTKEQWQALMADYATVGTQAAQDAQTASTAASTATTAAQTATTKAGEASASAEAAAESAAAIGTPDTTLTQSGIAADAKAVGDELSTIKEDFKDIFYESTETASVEISDNSYTAVTIKTGDSVVIKPKNGGTFPANNIIYTYNESKGYINNINITSGTSEKTLTAGVDIYWLKCSNSPSAPYTVTYTTKVYNEDSIEKNVENLKYAYEIPLKRCYFVRGAWMNSSNGFVDDTSMATSSIGITISSPVKIVSDNANVQFAVMQNSSYILDDWTDSVELSGLDGAFINMRVASGAEMTGTLVDALHIYTTETGYKEFVQNYTYTIKNTDRFPSYSEYVGVNRYATDLSANNVGCLLRNSSVQSSTFPFICDKDVTVWVGRYNGQTMTVIIDGVATTVNEGRSLTIPANTYFTCYWYASSGSKSECTMYVTDYEVGARLLNPTLAGSQMLTNATTSQSIDTSFMVGDKVFMLSKETGGYAVKYGNSFTKTAQTLSNTLGHANACNYDAVNKKVYVSDWRDNPNTIYVLTVDTDLDTLTYEKTLTVPLATGRGSTEYFVFDSEKQIYFVGWKTGAAGTDPNTLMYGLYVLTTTGYELAWERQAVRPLILQSAIVHKHYIYIMECQMDYKTVGISRINMLTGEIEHNACTMAGSFVTYEGEGLTPIGDHAFVTSDHNGRTYFIGFSPKAR